MWYIHPYDGWIYAGNLIEMFVYTFDNTCLLRTVMVKQTTDSKTFWTLIDAGYGLYSGKLGIWIDIYSPVDAKSPSGRDCMHLPTLKSILFKPLKRTR